MITHPEHWMDIRKYRGLLEVGSVTYADGCGSPEVMQREEFWVSCCRCVCFSSAG
jgi:hypothetical protein